MLQGLGKSWGVIWVPGVWDGHLWPGISPAVPRRLGWVGGTVQGVWSPGASGPPPADWAGSPPPLRVPPRAGYHVSGPISQDHPIGACSPCESGTFRAHPSVETQCMPCAQCREGEWWQSRPHAPSTRPVGTSPKAVNGPRGGRREPSSGSACSRRDVCCLKKQLQVIRVSDLLSISMVHRSSSISVYR